MVECKSGVKKTSIGYLNGSKEHFSHFLQRLFSSQYYKRLLKYLCNSGIIVRYLGYLGKSSKWIHSPAKLEAAEQDHFKRWLEINAFFQD